jgi:tellurite methyltransferase
MDQWNNIYKKEGRDYSYYNIVEPHKDMPKVAGLFRKNGVKRVLDLGCGAGRNLVYLARKRFELYGLDLAPEGLKIIRKSLDKERLGSELRKGDVYGRLPYPDGFFDAVISVQVLQHGNEQRIKGAIREIKRILKPRGIIFITLSGRISKGKVRPFLVKSAKKIAPNTYVPTQGQERGLTHFIYNKNLIVKHYRGFRIKSMWKDDKDYYCFVGVKR